MGHPDHAKQAVRSRLAVNLPTGVEDLVATVFRIGLGKHHQLGIGRIPIHLLVGLHQVIDFDRPQRQPKLDIDSAQRCSGVRAEFDRAQRLGHARHKPVWQFGRVEQQRFGHGIVQMRDQTIELLCVHWNTQQPTPLDSLHRAQTATTQNVLGLGSPWAGRATAWQDDQAVRLEYAVFKRIGRQQITKLSELLRCACRGGVQVTFAPIGQDFDADCLFNQTGQTQDLEFGRLLTPQQEIHRNRPGIESAGKYSCWRPLRPHRRRGRIGTTSLA